MAIRFDYSWLPEAIRSKLAERDPSPGDFEITEQDFEHLPKEDFQTMLETAKPYWDQLIVGKLPFVLMSRTGKTFLLTEEPQCTENQAACYRLYDKEGAQVGTISVDAFGKLGEPDIGVWTHFATIKQLCKPSEIQSGGTCARGEVLDMLSEQGTLNIFPNSADYEIVDVTPPQMHAERLHSLFAQAFGESGDNERSLLSATRQENVWSFSFPESVEADMKQVLIVDGTPYPAQGMVSIPLNAKDIRLRLIDHSGVSAETHFDRFDVGDKAHFVGRLPQEEQQIELFQQYLRRLIEFGYTIEITGDPTENPLEYLMKHYAKELFSKPSADQPVHLKLPAFTRFVFKGEIPEKKMHSKHICF